MIRDFTPIRSAIPDERKPGPNIAPPVLEFARAQPDFEAMDWTGAYAESVGRDFLEGLAPLPQEAA